MGILTRDKDISDMLRSRKCLNYLSSAIARINVRRRLSHFSGESEKSRVMTRVYRRTGERKTLEDKEGFRRRHV